MAAAAQSVQRKRKESWQWQTVNDEPQLSARRGASDWAMARAPSYSSDNGHVGMSLRKEATAEYMREEGLGSPVNGSRMSLESKQMGRQSSFKEILNPNQLNAARANNSMNLLSNLPPQEERMKEGLVEKRMPGTGRWGMRHLILTKSNLVIGKEESEIALEDIYLHDIVNVIRVSEASPQMSKAIDSKVVPTTRSRQAHRGLAELDTLALAFELETRDAGLNSGRKYLFRCGNLIECNQWVHDIQRSVDEALREWDRQHQPTTMQWMQETCRRFYQSQAVQGAVALLILSSFLVNLATAEWVPQPGSTQEKVFELLDTIFTSVFTVELLFNFFGHAFYPFFNDGWNLFDTFVVAVSWISFFSSGSSELNQLRILRVFRVIRLFRRLRRLKQIVNALTASLVPVASSFVVLALVTSIYAVVAVNILGERDPLRFGYFSTAFFTMAQLCVGWAEEELRPQWETEDNSIDVTVGVFFMSYILFAGVVLINIVVAVLLDEFITSVAAEKAEFERERIEKEGTSDATRLIGPLDPVLETLAQYGTAEDLAVRIESLYGSLDVDDSGSLSFQELSVGFSRLRFKPRIILTWDDFEIMTDGLELCDENGELGLNQFEELMRRQMQSYSQRTMANAMEENQNQEDVTRSMMLALKQLGISVEMISKEQHKIRRMLSHHPDIRKKMSVSSTSSQPPAGPAVKRTQSGQPMNVKRKLSAKKKSQTARALRGPERKQSQDSEELMDQISLEMEGSRSMRKKSNGKNIPKVLEGDGDVMELVQSYLDNSDDLSGAGTPPPLPGSLMGTPREEKSSFARAGSGRFGR